MLLTVPDARRRDDRAGHASGPGRTTDVVKADGAPDADGDVRAAPRLTVLPSPAASPDAAPAALTVRALRPAVIGASARAAVADHRARCS